CLPLGPAEAADTTPPAGTGPQLGSWQDAPPPVRGKEAAPAPSPPAPKKPPTRPPEQTPRRSERPPRGTRESGSPTLPAVPQDADRRSAPPPAAAAPSSAPNGQMPPAPV